jgi:hypothetical protein
MSRISYPGGPTEFLEALSGIILGRYLTSEFEEA